MSPFRCYILCTSPRSGSTLLCKLLTATGKAGRPDSHFHEPSLAAWLGYYDLERADFSSEREALAAAVEAARQTGTGDTGIFGLRLQRHSFDFFMQQLGRLYPGLKSDSARIEAAFGPTRFLHLTRLGKLDQAVSYVKAEQTGLWHRAADGSELERLSEPQDPSYDADAIAKRLAEAEALDAAWRTWFAVEGITPLQLTYEALAENPHATLATIMDALEVEWQPSRPVDPPVAKLADAVSRDWASRFLAERKGP
ncbi:MAG: Stf0 family sulfotransferase [Pseudomonadota bacterium]